MDHNNKKFDEQEAPLKNTDHAFVQVGSRGEPVLPKENKTEKKSGQQNEENDETRHTSIEHR